MIYNINALKFFNDVNKQVTYKSNKKNLSGDNTETVQNFDNDEKAATAKINKKVFLVTAIGTSIPLAYTIIKEKKHPQTAFKNRFSELMAEVKDLLMFSTGSIGAGLLSGLLVDKGKNKWRKIKEANYQFITNEVVPVFLQAAFIALIDKHVIAKKFPNDLKKLNNLLKEKKLGKVKWNDKRLFFNKVMGARMLGGVAGIAGSLVVGTFLSNIVNNKIITKGEPYIRKAKPSDLVIQSDNIFAAMAMLKIPGVKEFIIPILSVMSGYETGTK